MPTPLLPQIHHLPIRPSWECRACARPWPCAAAKGDLGAEFVGHPALLFYYMAAQMVAFVEDLSLRGEHPTPNSMYPRVVGWIRLATAKAA
jgi:hypothetical protein